MDSKSGAESQMSYAAKVPRNALVRHSGRRRDAEIVPRNRKVLMTYWVSPSNELGVLVQFVGSRTALDLVTGSFRQARRSSALVCRQVERQELPRSRS